MSWLDQVPADSTLEDVKRSYVLHVLERNNYHRTEAAEQLGISIRGVRNLINKYRGEGEDIPESPYWQKKGMI